ncbi:MAG: hypothetical protein QMC38_12625 [Sinobacterium sp.]
MKPKNKKHLISILIMAVFIITGVTFYKIATDEVFYLCGNFSTGTTKLNVVRQLETANLSSHTHTINENGSTIVFSSRLFFVINKCIIELDKTEKVVLAGYK